MTRTFFHNEAAQGTWGKLSLVEQMGNIGSEVARAAQWQERNEKFFWGAVSRALELFDLTLGDPRWKTGRQEIAVAKEVFCDAALGGKEYHSSLADLERYFLPFAFAARKGLL